MKDTGYLIWLLDRQQQENLSPAEQEFLNNFYDKIDSQTQDTENIPFREDPRQEIKKMLDIKIQEIEDRRRSFSIPFYIRYAALIAVTLGGLYFGYKYIFSFEKSGNSYRNDVLPAKGTVSLVTAAGKTIDLDGLKTDSVPFGNGSGVTKGNTSPIRILEVLTEVNGRYQKGFNTISTTKGRTLRLILPDHSTVQLNSESSLKIPENFNNNRKVYLSGEAYFRVAKKPGYAFEVVCKKQTIRVLGTHFNVSAYPHDNITRTTLVEGSLSIKDKTAHMILAPGQQAISGDILQPIKKRTVDPEEAIGWTREVFSFNGKDIRQIMQEISRWYNIQVEFCGTPSKEPFFGEIARNSKLSEVIKMLEISGIKIELHGNTIKLCSHN